MKAYVLMWGNRVCSSGIARPYVPDNPDIWFDLKEAQESYKDYNVTTEFKTWDWWLLELVL